MGKRKLNITNLNETYIKRTPDEIKLIEEELKNPIGIWKDYILTNNYIIIQKFDVDIIKYEDVLLVYKTFSLGARSLNIKLVLVIKDNKKYDLTIGSIGGIYPALYDFNNDFIKIIKKKNPKILTGRKYKKYIENR